MSTAIVVTVHVSSVDPSATVAVCAVLKDALDVSRTANVWPLAMLPDVPQAPPLMDICGAPCPDTSTSPGQPAGMPLMVMALAVVKVESEAFVASVNVKALEDPLPYVPVTPRRLSPQRMLEALNCGSFVFRSAASVHSPASSF